MATRIGVIDHGRLVQIGTPREIYEDPAYAYVATRLGSPAINLLPRALLPRRADAGRRRDDRRPHRASAHHASGERLRPWARSRWIEHLGDQNHLHVDLAGTDSDLVVRWPTRYRHSTWATPVAIELARRAVLRRRGQPDQHGVNRGASRHGPPLTRNGCVRAVAETIIATPTS